MKNLALAFSLIACLLGCRQGGSSGSPAAAPAVAETDTISVPAGEVGTLLDQAVVQCANPGACPGAAALMVVTVGRNGDTVELQQCTSFLVAPDIMATNSHCLPSNLRQVGASCRERIGFVFPQRRGVTVRAQCAEVLSFTEITRNRRDPEYMMHPDLAFLRLTRTVQRARPLRIDRQGVPDGFRLRALKIDPLAANRIGGVLRVQACEARQGTLVNPSYVDAQSAIVTASGCETVSGNSGSAVVDERGAVRGILMGVLPPENPNSERFASFQTPDRFDTMSFITNMACTDVPSGVTVTGSRGSSEICSRRLGSQVLVERSFSTTSADLERMLSEWRPSAPAMFNFQLQNVRSPVAASGIPFPSCIRPLAVWTGSGRTPDRLEGFTQSGDLIQLRLRVPLFSLRSTINRRYRVASETAVTDHVLIDMSFGAQEFNQTGRVTADFSFSSENGLLSSVRGRRTLRVCP